MQTAAVLKLTVLKLRELSTVKADVIMDGGVKRRAIIEVMCKVCEMGKYTSVTKTRAARQLNAVLSMNISKPQIPGPDLT